MINIVELESLREMIASHQTVSKKLQDYSNKCNDAQLKQFLSQSAQKANETANNLINML